jgi:PAS domain S-box-containing protein
MPESGLLAIAGTTVGGVVLMDAGGRIRAFDRICERMFGYAEEDVVGRDLEQLIQPVDPSGEQGQDPGGEMLGRRQNGETFPIELSVSASEQNGDIFVILRDITERKRRDDQRERRMEALAAANEELTRFAHLASHDLKEPLRMVAAFCELLSKDYGGRLDERGREYLSLAVSAATQMRNLLDDLVDYQPAGGAAERDVWFDTDEAVDQAIAGLKEMIRESGAEIVRDDLPWLHGNPVRFTRLIQNLVGNALKYVAPGTRPRIRLSADRDDAFWRFAVADNGIGVEPRHYDRIFEPFKRLHPQGRYDGSGLGLAICRKIVDDFGGRLWVDSVPGAGSIFSFTAKALQEEGEHGRRAG